MWTGRQDKHPCGRSHAGYLAERTPYLESLKMPEETLRAPALEHMLQFGALKLLLKVKLL